ncbi:hypothetical protein EVAR_79711_1 [Eumeta japonica]|uniref:Uncharacterized protein n=1 Tax=Eumeta variegata TaxID=151549 RepID=A0A4C1T942_EUMVA|nr:hypothetical protein EVAR_79711_1 [Eumeta japonica]
MRPRARRPRRSHRDSAAVPILAILVGRRLEKAARQLATSTLILMNLQPSLRLEGFSHAGRVRATRPTPIAGCTYNVRNRRNQCEMLSLPYSVVLLRYGDASAREPAVTSRARAGGTGACNSVDREFRFHNEMTQLDLVMAK